MVLVIEMYMKWELLKQYKCPIPGCGEPMKESKDGSMHLCTSCPFKISEEKISQIVVLRYRKLEPPQFIKEMREKDKKEEDRFCAVCEKKLDTSKNYGKSITCSHKCGAIHRFSPRMHVDMNAAINRFLNGQIDLDPALIIPDNKIEGIFNLSLINSMNIGDDVTVFSIKK